MYQYDAVLAYIGTIKNLSREKLYQELSLETLCKRCWLRRLCLLYQIKMDKFPSFLLRLILNVSKMGITRNSNGLKVVNFFKNCFFPSALINWNKLDLKLQNSFTQKSFKKQIFKIIRPNQNNNFKIYNSLGIKLLPRLRVGLSYLKEPKFKNDFQNFMDPLWSCGNNIQSTIYLFLHCTNLTFQRQKFLNEIHSIDSDILAQKETSIIKSLSFGKQKKGIIKNTIGFILSTDRFSCLYFQVDLYHSVMLQHIISLFSLFSFFVLFIFFAS